MPLYLSAAAPLCTYAARAAPFVSWCLAGPQGPAGSGLSATSGLVLFRINPVGDAFLALSIEPLIAPAELAFNAFALAAVWLLTLWHGARFPHLGATMVPQLLLRLASISVIHTLARYRRSRGRAAAVPCGAGAVAEKGVFVARKAGSMDQVEGLDGEAALKGRPELDGGRGSAGVSRSPSDRGAASTSEASSAGVSGTGSRSVHRDVPPDEQLYHTANPGQLHHTYTPAAGGDAAAAVEAAFESALSWEVAALHAGHSTDAGHCDTAALQGGYTPPLVEQLAAQQYPGLLAAGSQPAYRSVVRRRTTRIKIPFAEPEQLSPGFMERLQGVAAQHGVVLAGVYVRPGCIELLLDMEVWSDTDDTGSSGSSAGTGVTPSDTTSASGVDFLLTGGGGGGAGGGGKCPDATQGEQEMLEQVLAALRLQLQGPAAGARPQSGVREEIEQAEDQGQQPTEPEGGLWALRRLMREQPVTVQNADLQAWELQLEPRPLQQPQLVQAPRQPPTGTTLPAAVMSMEPRVHVWSPGDSASPLTLNLRLLAPAGSLFPEAILPGGSSRVIQLHEQRWPVEALVRCQGEYLQAHLQAFGRCVGGGGSHVSTGMVEVEAVVQVHVQQPLRAVTALMVEVRCCGRLGSSATLLVLRDAELLPDLQAAVAGLAPRPGDLDALLLDVATWLRLVEGAADPGQHGAAAADTAAAVSGAAPGRGALLRLGAHLFEYASRHSLSALASCVRRGLVAAGLPAPVLLSSETEPLRRAREIWLKSQQQQQQQQQPLRRQKEETLGVPRPEIQQQFAASTELAAGPCRPTQACSAGSGREAKAKAQAEAKVEAATEVGPGSGREPMMRLVRRSLARSLGWQRGSEAEEAAFEAYAAPLVFAHVHAIQAVEALSLLALLFRARHNLLSRGNLTTLSGCCTGTLAGLAWLLLPRPAWVRLVNGLKVPRYLMYMLAKAMIGFLGFPAPPGIIGYQLGPAMLVMEGLLLPGSNLLPFGTAALITLAKWPLGVAMMLGSGATAHLPTAVWLCGRIVLLALLTTATCHTQIRLSFALRRQRAAVAKARAGLEPGAAAVQGPGVGGLEDSKKTV
ncbi:hypothetical protein HYH02_000360 [Chlamydomonas schloesseri]|uniref:Uncharacterized protein n=1 Tax=Chlamydomonas schloesseri TaxID=2026947 RepID=A0A835WUI3_9CHLO|nr:hypothetical protein HYH02_000360 [Chlamydomonas schloesseri]|eukprot:KAG2454513.1 hypothetical protein HYH02_000360 [Chlamydomonas schloesseri]